MVIENQYDKNPMPEHTHTEEHVLYTSSYLPTYNRQTREFDNKPKLTVGFRKFYFCQNFEPFSNYVRVIYAPRRETLNPHMSLVSVCVHRTITDPLARLY